MSVGRNQWTEQVSDSNEGKGGRQSCVRRHGVIVQCARLPGSYFVPPSPLVTRDQEKQKGMIIRSCSMLQLLLLLLLNATELTDVLLPCRERFFYFLLFLSSRRGESFFLHFSMLHCPASRSSTSTPQNPMPSDSSSSGIFILFHFGSPSPSA